MTSRNSGASRSARQLLLVALVGASTCFGTAYASSVDLLDTGNPPANPTLYVFNTVNSYGAEFSATAGSAISQLNVYLTQGAGQPGQTFNFDLYSATGFIGGRNLIPIHAWAATYTQNGWNDLTLSSPFVLTTTGNYYITIQAQSGTNLDVAGTSNNGSAPALAFAYRGTGPTYAPTTADIGIQVVTTPLPATGLLFLTGLAGLGAGARRRRDDPQAR